MTGGGGKVGTTWLNEGREGGGSPDASRRPCLGRVGPRWGQSTLAPGPRSPPLPADAGRCADRAAPEQSGRTDHLGTQPGAARAGQRIEREIPRQATHPDPRGNRHGEEGSRVGGPPAARSPCPPGRSWPLPPPRGTQQAYRREVLRIRVPFQASSQNTSTLRNPPPTRSHFSHGAARPLRMPSSCLQRSLAVSLATAPPLTSLPSPGPSLFMVSLFSHAHLHFSLSPTKLVFRISTRMPSMPRYSPALLLRMGRYTS